MRAAGWSVALLLASLLSGCGAPADPGRDALLQIDGAPFYPGPLPEASGGPAVTGVLIEQSVVRRGEVGRQIGGSLAPGATAALLALAGDRGFWVVTAGVPDVTAPEEPTFHAAASFAAAAPPGPRDLLIVAIDREGRAGPPRSQGLTILDAPAPAGALVLTLSWDTEADLDLHAVTPAGAEIWARQPVEAPGRAGGVLDLDSNGRCVIDGRRQESVTWAGSPPPGRYLARVDTASLCGAPFANWRVSAWRDGALRAEAQGQSDEASTRGPHDRGAGLQALALDVQ